MSHNDVMDGLDEEGAGLSLVPLTEGSPTDDTGPSDVAAGSSNLDNFRDEGVAEEEDGPLLQAYEGGPLQSGSSDADADEDGPPVSRTRSLIQQVVSVVGVVLVLFWLNRHAGK